jgi:Uma2 family endonuclease
MALLEEKDPEYAAIEQSIRAVELVEEDDENMESDWHRLAMTLLIEVIVYFLRERDDFYVGGNMFIYFDRDVAQKRNFRGPDFFFVRGVPREPLRRYWMPWDEGGRLPDVIIELLSPKTAQEDLTTKKDIYEKVFHTHEYYCYDPETHALQGWRLIDHRYEPMNPDESRRLWSEELGLWLGTWEGRYQERETTWLRFYDAQSNVVETLAEAEHQRAEVERQRAEAAEAELARLKAQMAQPGNSPAGQSESTPS